MAAASGFAAGKFFQDAHGARKPRPTRRKPKAVWQRRNVSRDEGAQAARTSYSAGTRAHARKAPPRCRQTRTRNPKKSSAKPPTNRAKAQPTGSCTPIGQFSETTQYPSRRPLQGAPLENARRRGGGAPPGPPDLKAQAIHGGVPGRSFSDRTPCKRWATQPPTTRSEQKVDHSSGAKGETRPGT